IETQITNENDFDIFTKKYFQAISKQKEVFILITITSKKYKGKTTRINRFNDTDSSPNHLIFQALLKPRGIKNCDTAFYFTISTTNYSKFRTIPILEEFFYKVDKEENTNREIAKHLKAFNQEAIR
ncbi:26131_t:CDS:2, partial [Racocetra persica]